MMSPTTSTTDTVIPCSTVFELQLKLEEKNMADAAVRLNKIIQTNAPNGTVSTNTKVGQRFLRRHLDKLSERLDVLLRHAEDTKKKGGVGGRPNPYLVALKNTGLSSDVIAFCVLNHVINSVMTIPKDSDGEKQKLVGRALVARRIGRQVHNEWRVHYFRQDENRNALMAKLQRDFDARGYPASWRERTIKNYFDAEKLSWSMWTDRAILAIGMVLLEKYEEIADGMFIVDQPIRRAGTKRVTNVQKYLIFSPEFLDMIEDAINTGWKTTFVADAMLVKPVAWSSKNIFRGPYCHSDTPNHPFIRRTGKPDAQRINNADLRKVLAAVNVIQETPWKLNHTMLEVVEWAYAEAANDIGKMTCLNELPEPPVPTEGMSEEAKDELMKERFLWRNATRIRKSMRLLAAASISSAKRMKTMLEACQKFSNHDRFYFPSNCDYRGRVYPMAGFLHPQGVDYVKSMLEFADGQPILCDDDAAWLAISCANTYGYDKVSLQERVDWVFDNEEMVLSVAADWRHDLRWTHASEPFMFLRSCLEWAGLKAHGFGYMSHLPVHLDATASGLQHFAAMRRSEQGKSVNLVPHLPRQDVYGDVAKKVIAKLEELGTTEAMQLLSLGINRKTTKRQVMTVPYAAKSESCLKYTRDWLAEVAEEKPLPWAEEEHGSRVGLLGSTIWKCIGETLTSSTATMSWISAVAGEYGRQANARTDLVGRDKALHWTTPDGFPVQHYKEKEKRVELDMVVSGQRLRMQVAEGTQTVDTRATASAVAPNFVHSLDACHCRMAVLALRDMFPEDCAVAVIHDSFGTHASRTRAFVERCIRPTFVQMYEEHDVLAELAQSASALIKKPEVLAVPEQGTLDLRGVLESEFFFS